MSLTRRRFITISAGLGLSAIAGSAAAAPTIWQGAALGADAKLLIHGVSQTEGQRLIALARAEVRRLENIFSIYKTDSAISRLNRDGALVAPPFELLEVLSLAKNINALTHGRFDPTVQPLWALYAERAGHPSAGEINKTRHAVGLSKMDIATDAIRFKKAGMAMTLNGIAQGYITDRVVMLLKTQGLQNAVVDMGEISAMGQNDASKPWKIGLAETGDLRPTDYVHLQDMAIATSAPHGTTFDGKTSHIIDPLNGMATRSPWKRLSVIHKSAAFADGLSTALVMMDKKQLQDVKLGGKARIIALGENGERLS